MRYKFIGGSLTLAIVLMAGAALAENGAVLGTVQRGNTTIVFEAANTSDLPMADYHAWEQFAQQHPGIVRQLRGNPNLIKNHGWMMSHEGLREFFSAHPKAHAAMKQDPGNFFVPFKTARR